MNILVIGAGLLGRTVAEKLCLQGHDVSILDEKEENIALLGAEFDGVTFVGFPLDLRALREAGIESCDAVAVSTSDDNLSITVGQIAKDYFKVGTVVTRISDPYRENIFESFGLQTICSTNLSSQKIVDSIISPQAAKQLSFGTHTINFTIREVSKRLYGKTLREAKNISGCLIFALLKDGEILKFPDETPDEIIEANDFFVLYAKID